MDRIIVDASSVVVPLYDTIVGSLVVVAAKSPVIYETQWKRVVLAIVGT